jgi:hypothetical protein
MLVCAAYFKQFNFRRVICVTDATGIQLLLSGISTAVSIGRQSIWTMW